MEHRKADHLDMAFRSQVDSLMHDSRFNYEPMICAHPNGAPGSISFLGRKMKSPIWISSMTGGTLAARKINTNLAKVCHDFGLGMGLGSCRILLSDESHLPDFDMRTIMGDDLPLYANLGICQVEQLVLSGKVNRIRDLVSMLRADGLIVHVNPLQEWFQPGGDRITRPPVETMERLLDGVTFPVIVKEVGQGMGPDSLLSMMRLPISAIEFGAFGGTNFSKLELLRSDAPGHDAFDPFTRIGETAEEMIGYINSILASGEPVKCNNFIVSGGIRNFLDGYFLCKKIHAEAVYGQASEFLRHAREGYEEVFRYTEHQVIGLQLATSYLTLKKG
jgi:isopentenyl-diphosphate delta-isomerase